MNRIMNLYILGNRWVRRLLWGFVILGLLASLPLAYARLQTEKSANQVEIVFDYRDLLEISNTQADPTSFVQEQLKKMKAAGATSMAVYESTLEELAFSRHIELFSAHDLAASGAVEAVSKPGTNDTYLVFLNSEAENRLKPSIEREFSRLGVAVNNWSFKGQTGLHIHMALEDASLRPMDPDPITMENIKKQGFQIVARLSNKRELKLSEWEPLLQSLNALGVKRIVVDGYEVPGYGDTPQLLAMSKLLKKYGIGLAAIEMSKDPQKGFTTVANALQYNVVRLHSYTEKDSEKFMEPLADIPTLVATVADRFVLAVQDRNIRMIFINSKVSSNPDKWKIDYPLDGIYKALNGPDGAVPRLIKSGFTLGPAEPFKTHSAPLQNLLGKLLLLGAVALITLFISLFFPELSLLVFLLGLIGGAGLNTVSFSSYSQSLALLSAIAAPSIAVIMAIRSVRRRQQSGVSSPLAAAGYSVALLVKTSLISVIGVLYVVALLNHIVYFLVLDQFRGVSLLHLAPIGIVVLYAVLFSEHMTYKQRIHKLMGILKANIKILWVVAACVAAAAGYYYLTRTGNEGQVSGVEKVFRSFLEDRLGVRPRTKEFLFAHPIFIFSIYLSLKYRNAFYLIVLGVIGQLSIVDTFAHLHTPLTISAIRISYGILIGAVIGLVLVAVWEFVSRSWKRWAAPLLKD